MKAIYPPVKLKGESMSVFRAAGKVVLAFSAIVYFGLGAVQSAVFLKAMINDNRLQNTQKIVQSLVEELKSLDSNDVNKVLDKYIK
jgi:hypothetical protein